MPRALTVAPRSNVYTGMLAMTCLSMFLGILFLSLEANEYGWETKPPAGPSITLPKATLARPDAGS